MMKKTKILLAFLAMLSMTIEFTGCAGCAGCNENTKPVTITPTAEVTATAKPTATTVPTATTEVTKEPEQTPTAIPDTPTPEPTATPAPTVTPEPTATPVPTSTPVPTKAVTEDMKLVESVKMGDNVWYDFYDDGTLIVRGTGKTRDVDASFVIDDKDVMEKLYTDSTYHKMSTSHITKVHKIVIEEGITELGDWSLCGFCYTDEVYFPSTLSAIGYAALYSTITSGTECVGLRTDMKIEKHALASFYSPNTNLAPEFKEYAVAPALKPKPTATPLPNPDKPRKAATLNVGNNITYEFWDNGVMYVKGKGKIPKQSELFWLDEPYWNPTGYTLAETTHTVVVEEGVTSIGKYTFTGLPNDEWYLPKSLTDVSQRTVYGKIFHGYYNEKAVTVDTTAYSRSIPYETFIEILENKEVASKYNAVITWE